MNGTKATWTISSAISFSLLVTVFLISLPSGSVEGKKITNIYSVHIYMPNTVFKVFLYVSPCVIFTTIL